MTTEHRLLTSGLDAVFGAMGERHPDRPEDSGGFVEWRGCQVTFDEDNPDDATAWGITFNDKRGVSRELPQALVELLIEKHYEEIVEKVMEEAEGA